MSFSYQDRRHPTVIVKKSSSGISFFGLLTIVFIVLKLCHVIDWGWIWVLAPIWMSGGLVILAFALVLAFIVLAAIVGGITNLFRSNKRKW